MGLEIVRRNLKFIDYLESVKRDFKNSLKFNKFISELDEASHVSPGQGPDLTAICRGCPSGPSLC